ncbi:MAG: sigma-70 family RNA polymerase sigma factor [Actinomycetota bacterium]
MNLRHEIPDSTETDPGEQKVQMETISDAELLLRSTDRPEAFSMFYERHARDLLRFFARRTFDPETAADLTAETFAEAFASRGNFRGEGTDGVAWLYGVAHHQLSRFFRRGGVDSRARRKLGMPERNLSPDDFDRIEELVDFAPMRDAVEQALFSLPDEQRDATRLRVIEERPYSEVADELDCTEATARQRVSRGLRRLAQELEPRARELAMEVTDR